MGRLGGGYGRAGDANGRDPISGHPNAPQWTFSKSVREGAGTFYLRYSPGYRSGCVITTGDIMTNFEPPKRRFFGATRQGIDGRGLIGPGPGQYDADWYSQSERGAARGNCAPKVSSLTMKRGQDPHNFAPLYRGFQSVAKRQFKI